MEHAGGQTLRWIHGFRYRQSPALDHARLRWYRHVTTTYRVTAHCILYPGIRTDASGAIATVAKWFVRLIVLVVAFDALGLPAVSQVLQSLLLWLPNLVVAIVALVIGGLAANALASLVRGAAAESGFTNADLLATIARVAVWAFAIVVAVNQLGIATELVNTLFMATVGAVALAAGLAFGLGGRDTAGQIVASWYARSRRAAPKLERAADAVGRRARVETESEGMDDRTSSTAVSSTRRTTGTDAVEPR